MESNHPSGGLPRPAGFEVLIGRVRQSLVGGLPGVREGFLLRAGPPPSRRIARSARSTGPRVRTPFDSSTSAPRGSSAL
jgi:hypothetical protein